MAKEKALKDFDAELFHKLVEKMTVWGGNGVMVM
jgi:hypothetical protein